MPSKRPHEPTDLSKVLRRAMSERGWNQTRLAKESGVSQSFISQLLSGDRRDMGASIAAKLEAAFADPGLRLSGWVSEADQIPVVGVDEFLASDLAADITQEERQILERASWMLPVSRTATKGDWYAFLRWLRGLPGSKGDGA